MTIDNVVRRMELDVCLRIQEDSSHEEIIYSFQSFLGLKIYHLVTKISRDIFEKCFIRMELFFNHKQQMLAMKDRLNLIV